MTHYLFIKLSEKVKNCDLEQIKDYDFEFDNITEGFNSAWFAIHRRQFTEDYCVEINENGRVYLTQGESRLFEITGDDSKNWKSLAESKFMSRYEDRIQKKMMEDSYWNWVDNDYDSRASRARNYSF